VRLLNSTGLRVVMVLSFVCGVGLLLFSLWLSPLAKAERAALQQDYIQALEYYAVAESRFDQFGFARQLLPSSYDSIITNRLRILYRLDELDKLIEMAAVHSGHAGSRFWSGSALFAKAIAQTEKEAQVAWLGRAREEFRSALELVPNDWDTKYNYELTERLLAELRDKPSPPEQILELLRPKPKEGEPPSRPVG
jgi:hypothetical protein